MVLLCKHKKRVEVIKYERERERGEKKEKVLAIVDILCEYLIEAAFFSLVSWYVLSMKKAYIFNIICERRDSTRVKREMPFIYVVAKNPHYILLRMCV